MTVAASIKSYLLTQLAKIRTGQHITLYNGTTYNFQTNAGALVYENMEFTEDSDTMPFLVLLTGKNSSSLDETVELGMENHLLDISIEGMIEDTKDGATADKLLEDIAAVVKQAPWFGDLILELQNYEADASPPNIGEKIISAVKASFGALYTAPYGSE